MSLEEGLVTQKELINVKRRRSQTFVFEKIERELLEKREEEGWQVDKILKNRIKIKKPKPLDILFEDEVWLLFASLGFYYLNKDRHLEIYYGTPGTATKKQIDVLAIDDETIIFVECKCAKTGKKGNFKDDIEAIYGIRNGLYDSVRRTFPNRKFKYILATKNYDISDADSKRMKEIGIHHFDEYAITYFTELAKHLGECARYQLLGNLFAGQKINAMENKIPAIRGEMGGYTYYSFSIEPDKLLKISYILHRNEANSDMMPTYQRIIKRNRLKEIQQFLNNGGFFPNSIVISIDSKNKMVFDLATPQSDTTLSRIGILHLPQLYRSAYIIDGQHRLYGYAESKYVKSNSIPVVAFENLPQDIQLKLFMEINENQKSVSKNLQNTLNIDILWNSDNWNKRRRALRLNIAQSLGERQSSPLFNRVVIGENEVNATCCIKLDTIESALKSTNFLSRYGKGNIIIENGTFDKGNNDATKKVLLPFIIASLDFFRENLPEEWDKGERDQGVLSINNSIHALIRVLNDIVNHLIILKKCNPQVDNLSKIMEEVECYLAPIVSFYASVTDDQRKEIKTSYGSGGKKDVWRLLQKVIADARADFMPEGLEQWIKDNTKQFNTVSYSMINDIDSLLRKEIAQRLQSKYGLNWLANGLPPKVYKQANNAMGEQNYSNKNSGINKEVSIWDCVKSTDYKDIMIFGQNWTDLFENLFTRPEEKKLSGKGAKTNWLVTFSRIASNATASYSISEEEYLFLKSIHEWLFKS